jgi:alpha-L-fucosidase
MLQGIDFMSQRYSNGTDIRDFTTNDMTRRSLLAGAAAAFGVASLGGAAAPTLHAAEADHDEKRGSQRLSIEQLRKWESLGYGMFIHFGINTFVNDKGYGDGTNQPAVYAPDKLDVDQWISVARDSGMKYAVLTAKHVAGHCLWPSKHTDYTVANSGNTTNVVERFVEACRRKGILPGLYYCSWDNHHRFGSRTIADWNLAPPKQRASLKEVSSFPTKAMPLELLAPYTTSLYQNFQTAQITDLLTEFGPIAETWVDIPGVLGYGYQEFLYNKIAKLQPETVVMMNTGVGATGAIPADRPWSSDLVAMERTTPSKSGHMKWHAIEGQSCYVPCEVCDTIGKQWFFTPGDVPRSDNALLRLVETCRKRGTNLLLNVPPDTHGVIPTDAVAALARLAKNAGI